MSHKTEKDKYTTWYHLCAEFFLKVRLTETKNRKVVARGHRVGEIGRRDW